MKQVLLGFLTCAALVWLVSAQPVFRQIGSQTTAEFTPSRTGPRGASTNPDAMVTINVNKPVKVEGIPRPDQMMRIVNGTFTVPADKIFVVTGVGTTGSSGNHNLRINGVFLAQLVTNLSDEVATIAPIPPGMTASAGDVVEALTTSGAASAIVLGYLADA